MKEREIKSKLKIEVEITLGTNRLFAEDTWSKNKRKIRAHFLEKWESDWATTEKGRTTKEFFPSIRERLKIKLETDRKLTEILSGHGDFRYYLKKIGKIQDDECECKLEADTAEHRLLHCPIFLEERTEVESFIGPISLESLGRHLGCKEVANIIKKIQQ
jgi:hypothetical protein